MHGLASTDLRSRLNLGFISYDCSCLHGLWPIGASSSVFGARSRRFLLFFDLEKNATKRDCWSESNFFWNFFGPAVTAGREGKKMSGRIFYDEKTNGVLDARYIPYKAGARSQYFQPRPIPRRRRWEISFSPSQKRWWFSDEGKRKKMAAARTKK